MKNKSNIVGFRLTDDELAIVTSMCESLGVTSSQLLRYALRYTQTLDADANWSTKADFVRFAERAKARTIFG